MQPADTHARKLFLGGRLRRIRRDLGLTQARMAEDLSISASYLNLLERNQRPVTAQMLLRLAEAYDLDLRNLTSGEGAVVGLDEIFADPLFKNLGIARNEVAELAENSPALSEAVARLYGAYIDRGRLIDLQSLEQREDARSGISPVDWVRDCIHANKNHIPDLEDVGAFLSRALSAPPSDFFNAACERLKERYNVEVRVFAPEVLPNALRVFDRHRRRLMLSEALTGASRNFALAYQLTLLEHGAVIDGLVSRAAPPDAASKGLLKVAFANYAAGAVLMPYEDFYAYVERMRYDIGRIRSHFWVSYEQACHRLTTLGRPGARGVPFFMLRVDAAGNVSKRFASGAFPFSRFGGTCPRWNIHECFKTPGRVVTQVIATLDGERYFTISRTTQRVSASEPREGSELAIGLGCELKYADRLVYSRGLDLKEPSIVEVGPSCRICERASCPQRAAPPVTRTLEVQDFIKTVSPFPFAGE